MDTPEFSIFDMIVGAILLGVGLIYLTLQYRAVAQLSDMTNDIVLGNGVLFQQYFDTSINQVSDEELYEILMGYREYPIVIDGKMIDGDDFNYEASFSLIKEGFYTKSYECSAENEVIRIIYTYSGV